MSDTFLPGSGFDTYEQQDKVLVGLCGGTGCKAAVRILQQQGFAVMGAVVRLCTDDPVVDAAKEAAKALGIECITLNASELASQLAEETAAPADLRFPALLAAADRLGIQYIATGHRARVETGADGVHVLCPAEIADESARLAALPRETLGRLILPLGDFRPEDAAEVAPEEKPKRDAPRLSETGSGSGVHLFLLCSISSYNAQWKSSAYFAKIWIQLWPH